MGWGGRGGVSVGRNGNVHLLCSCHLRFCRIFPKKPFREGKDFAPTWALAWSANPAAPPPAWVQSALGAPVRWGPARAASDPWLSDPPPGRSLLRCLRKGKKYIQRRLLNVVFSHKYFDHFSFNFYTKRFCETFYAVLAVYKCIIIQVYCRETW